MGFLTNAKNAINAKAEENAKKELEIYLLDNETIEFFFLAKEDFGAVTNRRLLFMDKSILSKKKVVIGIPYNKITSVGLSRGGAMSFDKEVIINIGSKSTTVDTHNKELALQLYKEISSKII